MMDRSHHLANFLVGVPIVSIYFVAVDHQIHTTRKNYVKFLTSKVQFKIKTLLETKTML